MIQYTGISDQFKATILVFGDGATNTVNINLSQEPFNVKFSSNVPVRAVEFKDSPDAPPRLTQVEFVKPNLMVHFETPPPKTNFDYSSGPVGVPRTKFDVYFVYEVQPITRE
jgi:hypothetical protein